MEAFVRFFLLFLHRQINDVALGVAQIKQLNQASVDLLQDVESLGL